jgi:hypothetical protein
MSIMAFFSQSDEDIQLKNELEMLVERLKVSIALIYTILPLN